MHTKRKRAATPATPAKLREPTMLQFLRAAVAHVARRIVRTQRKRTKAAREAVYEDSAKLHYLAYALKNASGTRGATAVARQVNRG